MRAAVIDQTKGDEAAGYPVVNVILADASVDAPPLNCVLIDLPDDSLVGPGWLYVAAGFWNPTPPTPIPVDVGD